MQTCFKHRHSRRLIESYKVHTRSYIRISNITKLPISIPMACQEFVLLQSFLLSYYAYCLHGLSKIIISKS